jgi:DNA invertase Pin-like site-specific DNA recombinase
MTDWDEHTPVGNQYNLDDFQDGDPSPSGSEDCESDEVDEDPLPSIPEPGPAFRVDPKAVPSDKKLTTGYVRTSTLSQNRYGASLARQKSALREAIEDDEDAVMLTDIICDAGESGFNLDRSGIKTVFELASKGYLDELRVTKLDRIGRNAPETLHFIYLLQKEMNLNIVTANGDIDITNSIVDLLQTTLEMLMADFATERRVAASIKGQISQFENRNWYIFNNSAPLGYKPTDPSGVNVGSGPKSKSSWIEVDESEEEIVVYIFEQFVKTESYTETADRANRKYSDVDYDITRQQVKRIVQRDVYIGKPSHDLDTERVDDTRAKVVDSSLQIIDEETHDRAQELVRENKEQYSSNSDHSTPLDFLEHVAFKDVKEAFPNVEIACPDCGETELNHNGRRQAGEYDAFNLLCQSCGRQFKWPKKDQTKYFDDDRRGGT